MTPREVNIVVLSRLLRKELERDRRNWGNTITNLVDVERTIDPEGTL